jgi:hypothetical protein
MVSAISKIGVLILLIIAVYHLNQQRQRMEAYVKGEVESSRKAEAYFKKLKPGDYFAVASPGYERSCFQFGDYTRRDTTTILVSVRIYGKDYAPLPIFGGAETRLSSCTPSEVKAKEE